MERFFSYQRRVIASSALIAIVYCTSLLYILYIVAGLAVSSDVVTRFSHMELALVAGGVCSGLVLHLAFRRKKKVRAVRATAAEKDGLIC